jgi:hypothetical protein
VTSTPQCESRAGEREHERCVQYQERGRKGLRLFKLEDSLSYPHGAFATPIYVFPQLMSTATPGQMLLQTCNVQSDHGRTTRDGIKLEVSHSSSSAEKAWVKMGAAVA